ncbi:MAG: hypothetical protein KDD53_07395 [Bdellovibrionales bacterium]|nr:hypothetical protein [Bdellovibrionales bacterium]
MSATTTEDNSMFWIPFASLLAGLSIFPLLPIGMLLGIDGSFYSTFLVAHIIFLLFACTISLRYLVKLCFTSELLRATSASLLLIFLGLMFLGSIVPTLNPDSLTNYLALPRYWNNGGYVSQIEWHPASYGPLLTHLVYAGLINLRLTHLTSIYHLLYALPICALISTIIFDRLRNKTLALCGPIFFLCLPLTLKLGTSAHAAFPAALFLLSSIGFIFDWAYRNRKSRILILAGIALGLTLSTSVAAWIGIVPFLVCLYLFSRHEQTRFFDALGGVIIVGVFAFFTALAWPLKNGYWTFNPVYPLLQNQLGGPALGLSVIPSFAAIERWTSSFGGTWLGILLSPFSAILFGRDGTPEHFNGVLSPLLLLGCLAIKRCRGVDWRGFLILFSLLLFYSTWFFTYPNSDFLFLLVPLLVVMTITGLNEIFLMISPDQFKKGVIVFFSIAVIFDTPYVFKRFKKLDILQGSVMNLSSQQYLSEHLPEYSVLNVLNTTLGNKERAWVLFSDVAYFYAPIELRGGPSIESNFLQSLNDKNSSEDTYRSLIRLSRALSYIIVEPTRLLTVLSRPELKAWERFERDYLVSIYRDNRYQLWRITPPAKSENNRG